MRTLLVVFCALAIMSLSLEAKKKPASQNTPEVKAHQKQVKAYSKAHKASKSKVRKHKQTVN